MRRPPAHLHHRRARRRGDRHRRQHVRRCAAAACHVDLTAEPHLHAVARHAEDPRRPEAAGHAAPVLLPPAWRQPRRSMAPMPTACARCCGIRRRLARQDQAGILQSRAVQPDRGPRAGLRSAGRAGRPGRHQVYFGLAGSNMLDDERTIAFFQPDRERFLEYDLTKLVYELSNPKRPVVGVMSSLPLDGNARADDDDAGPRGRAALRRPPCCCGRPTR